jgi:hypothetical protein
MASLDITRAELAFLVMYLNKAETRDKICRAIQYGSKFVSNGEPGVAAQVDKSTSLARKVFRLAKTLNELNALLAPAPKATPVPIVLLGKAKNALVGTFLFLDQIVWAGRTGIYKNEERLELISRISLFCWMAGTFCTSVVEVCTFSQQCGSFMLRKSSYSRSFLIGSFLCSMTFLVFHSILGGSCCWALVHICIANWYRCSHQLRYTKH